MTNKDITIIITTFRSEDKIDMCLNSIDREIKVIVVENSNNEAFKNYLQNKYQNVECELTNDNLGYGKANNVGLKKVKTKYSLILNPDTTLNKDTIINFLIFICVLQFFLTPTPHGNVLLAQNFCSPNQSMNHHN